MNTVRRLARQMLAEKISEASAHDATLKKDVMSELVRARQNDADFALTDEGLMDQVARDSFLF